MVKFYYQLVVLYICLWHHLNKLIHEELKVLIQKPISPKHLIVEIIVIICIS